MLDSNFPARLDFRLNQMIFILAGPRMQSRRADNIGRQWISNVAAKLTNNFACAVFFLSLSVMIRLSDLMRPSETSAYKCIFPLYMYN